MKIAILSDLHMGYDRFYEDSFNQAEEALTKAAEMADVIIIPGDIFDFREPKTEVIARAFRIFLKIKYMKQWDARVKEILRYDGAKQRMMTDVPIIAISGTHERLAVGKENAVDLLSLAGLVANANESYVIVEKGSERLSVFGIGGVSEELFAEKIKEFNPKPIENAFNVFIFHQSLIELIPHNDKFARMDDLPKGFDLYIDGHIHSRVEKSYNGKPFLIPGSTVITQLKENEQESKGFYIFNTDSKSYSFNYINSRKFVILKYRLNKDYNIRDLRYSIADSINKLTLSDTPIILIKIEGDGSKAEIASLLKEIENLYSNRAYLTSDIDDLNDTSLQESINKVREGKVDGLTVKERALSMIDNGLSSKGYNIDVRALIEMLSADDDKDSIVKRVISYLDNNLA
ncbi:MAG: DNA double-strand break repair protein Mre11 [Candidatus Micrarchaeota archaeon]|nr:MAG: DNA double-strand break repair protein Mre11 [Candidatus Micrarchaeota archaeon]